MGMTITEKIMAAHAGKTHVEPGELIYCRLDGVLGNDITTPVAINEFDKLKLNSVFDQDKVFLVMDHFAPNKDIKSAMQIQGVREFAQKFGVTNYFEGARWESNTVCCRRRACPGDMIGPTPKIVVWRLMTMRMMQQCSRLLTKLSFKVSNH